MAYDLAELHWDLLANNDLAELRWDLLVNSDLAELSQDSMVNNIPTGLFCTKIEEKQ